MTNFDRRLHRIEAELPPDSGIEWLRPAWERHGSAWDVVKRRMLLAAAQNCADVAAEDCTLGDFVAAKRRT